MLTAVELQITHTRFARVMPELKLAHLAQQQEYISI